MIQGTSDLQEAVHQGQVGPPDPVIILPAQGLTGQIPAAVQVTGLDQAGLQEAVNHQAEAVGLLKIPAEEIPETVEVQAIPAVAAEIHVAAVTRE